MLEPMAVAVHAMRRLSLVHDASVAVCGLGTIGQLLIMFLLERGIKNIYPIGNKDSQKESVLAMGIPEENYCDMRTMDVEAFLKDRTDRVGVASFFECVGKNETVSIMFTIISVWVFGAFECIMIAEISSIYFCIVHNFCRWFHLFL